MFRDMLEGASIQKRMKIVHKMRYYAHKENQKKVEKWRKKLYKWNRQHGFAVNYMGGVLSETPQR